MAATVRGRIWVRGKKGRRQETALPPAERDWVIEGVIEGSACYGTYSTLNPENGTRRRPTTLTARCFRRRDHVRDSFVA